MKNKTILYIADKSLVHYMLRSRKVGGGTISTYQLLEYLKAHYHVYVFVFYPDLKPGMHEINGFRILNVNIVLLNRINFIDEFLKRLQYAIHMRGQFASIGRVDYIISELGENFGGGVLVGRKMNIPTLVWIRETTNLYRLKYYPGGKIKNYVNYFIKTLLFRGIDTTLLNRADCILTNSEFMKGTIKEEYVLDAKVIYPTIRKQECRRCRSGKYIGFINPISKKGLDIFVQLVARLDEYRFVTYGNDNDLIFNKSKAFDNWVVNGWTHGAGDIFNDIRILLVPSISPEAFGRVVIEAIQYGVLPIVSGTGGLPEAMGDDSLVVKDYHNIDEWQARICYYWENKAARHKKIMQLKQNLPQFFIENQGERLKDILEAISRVK